MKVFLLASLWAIACLCHAQKGFIYVHTQAINEESTPAAGFSFSVSGGPTSVPAFTLNDRPDIVNTNMIDIGSSSYADGQGELWAIVGGTTNAVYRRSSGSSAWTAVSTAIVIGGATTTIAPTTIDGAGDNQFVYTDGTSAYLYSAGSSKRIYDGSGTNSDAINITYGNGYIFLVTASGRILLNNNTTANYALYTDSWTTVHNNISQLVKKIDVRYFSNTASSSIVFATTSANNNVFAANFNLGGITNYSSSGAASDVAIGDDGSVFALFGSVNKLNGTTFVADATCPAGIAVTAGAGGQAWMIPNWAYNPKAIYTRGVDNASQVHWMDDERVRTTYTGNSILIPVTAGTYTITETKPSGWDIQGMIIYDPSGGSTGSPSTNTASITVAAGEVVNLIVQNEYLLPIAMQKQCVSNQVAEDFGTPASAGVATTVTSGAVTASVGPAPAGVTAYHKFNGTRFDDGYYSIVTQSLGWGNAGIVDHTTGTGYYMLVNASYQADQFYRKRITNLVPGITYKVGFWAIQVGSGGISPNILFGVSDSNAMVLNTLNTGTFTNQAWQQYTFNFTATTSVSDIYLQNNAAGGGGNDLGIDDITFTPLPTPMAKVTVPSATMCENSTYQFNQTPSGGLWTSSNTAIATINSSSGLLTGVASGSTTVHYILSNAIGCTTDSSAIVTITASPSVTTAAATTVVCSGEVINLTSSPKGGVPAYTYAWSSANGTFTGSQIIQNTTSKQISAGSYTYKLVVSDTKGCTATSFTTVTVSGNPAPAVTVSPGTATSVCAGASIALGSTPTGGTSPYNFAWSGSGIGSTNTQNTTAIPTTSGVYSLTVTDNKGCKVTANTEAVAVNPLPAVTISSGSGLLCSNQSLALNSFPTSGTPAYNYLWTGSPTGANVSAATNTQQNTTAKPTVAGSYMYNLLVTDSKGCTATASKTIAVTLSNNTPPTITVAPASASTICSLSSLSLTSALGNNLNSPYTYLWSSTTGAGISAPTTQNTSVVPTIGGSFIYTMTVTDKNGCTGTANTGVVTVNPSPTLTASSFASALCNGQTIDTLYASPGSGTTPYTYLWTASPSSNSGLSSANNTLQKAPVLPTGAGTYVYTIRVTDSKACSATATTSIAISNTTAPSISSISPSSTSVICGGTGAVNLTASHTGGASPFGYVWTGNGVVAPNSLTTTATPTSSGNYSYLLKIIDNIGCVATATTAAVTVNPVLSVNISPTSPTLCNGATATLSSVPGGGTGTYSSYSWSASAPAAGLGTSNIQNTTATPTAAGSYLYNVLVTDSKGCTASASTPTITRDGPFSITANVARTTVCSGSDVGLISTITGGAAPVIYAWIGSTGSGLVANNIQSPPAAPTTNGSNYAVLAVDNHGCTSSASTPTISINPLPVVNSSAGSTSVCSGSNVALSSTASGAGPFTYAWTGSGVSNNSIQNSSAIPTASGAYTVTVTDANSCQKASTTSAVIVNPNPVADFSTTGICEFEFNAVNAGSGAGYSWLLGPDADPAVATGTNLANVRFQTNGTKNVTLTVNSSSNCQTAVTKELTVGCSLLPVRLLHFKALYSNGEVVLQWLTADEKSTDYFIVEKSFNGISYSSIGKVNALNNSQTGGTTTYTLPDENLNGISGAIYYRLKMVDKNGITVTSSVVKVVIEKGVKLSVLNPSRRGILIQSNASNLPVKISLYNTAGQLLLAKNQQLNSGLNVLAVQIPSGLYYLECSTKDSKYHFTVQIVN